MQDQSNPLVVLTELVDNLRKATSIAEPPSGRRRQTFANYREQEREAVLILRQRGMAVEAIADELGLGDRAVRRYLASQ